MLGNNYINHNDNKVTYSLGAAKWWTIIGASDKKFEPIFNTIGNIYQLLNPSQHCPLHQYEKS